MTSQASNHYHTLGVSPDASPVDVRRAYRRLAQKYHPDRNDGKGATEARMASVNGAYDVLGDAQKRAGYDEAMAEAASRKRQTWARAAQLVPPMTRGSWTLVFSISALSIATFGFVTLYTAVPPRPVMVLPAPVSQTPAVVDTAAQLQTAPALPPVPALGAWKEPGPSQRPSFAATDPVTRLMRDGVKP